MCSFRFDRVCQCFFFGPMLQIEFWIYLARMTMCCRWTHMMMMMMTTVDTYVWRRRGEGQWGGGGERRPDRTCLRSSAHTGYTCSQTRLIVMLVMRMEMVSGEEERWSQQSTQLTWLARIRICVNRTRIAVAKTLLTKKVQSFPMWMWSWSYVAADGWN